MSPDANRVRVFLARASRRLAWIAALEGAAIGIAVALPLGAGLVLFSPNSVPLPVVAIALLVLGISFGAFSALRRPRSVPLLVERRAPHCRNVVLTAAELIDARTRARTHIGELVYRDAARAIEPLDTSKLFPVRNAIASFAAIFALWAVLFGFVVLRPAATAGARSTAVATNDAVIDDIGVVITAPAYTGRAVETLRNPARIVAAAGSRIRLTVRADADAVTLEKIGETMPLERSESRTFTGEVVADADGYIAVTPMASGGRAGVRRLIGLTVTPDRAPRVTVSAPGRDLFLPDANRAVDVKVDASDDLGLASLRMRYTKVSGSGEQFQFTDGTVPLTVVRNDARNWSGRGVLRLNQLGLEPGDLIVYRGVAADQRPGAPAAESDAFIIEITAPGSIPAEGFSVDDDDKYALSQQMVVVKTERLIARARSLNSDSVAREALAIAAEQRAVRAEFVFMMGGELAEEVLAAAGITDLDETAEAEAEEDIAAGRLANRGRDALVQAIRSMSRANTALIANDLTKALAEEKAAVTHLERAFSRTRYILRALTQRERLDLTRRLTGELSSVPSATRPVADAETPPRITALRRALAAIAALAADPAQADGATRTSLTAQRILEVDPSATALQQVAAQLNDAATALAANRVSAAAPLLDRAAMQLAASLRAELVRGPHAPSTLEAHRLEGALADALRKSRER